LVVPVQTIVSPLEDPLMAFCTAVVSSVVPLQVAVEQMLTVAADAKEAKMMARASFMA